MTLVEPVLEDDVALMDFKVESVLTSDVNLTDFQDEAKHALEEQSEDAFLEAYCASQDELLGHVPLPTPSATALADGTKDGYDRVLRLRPASRLLPRGSG